MMAAENPMSEKTWVSPTIKVRIATMPKSSFSKNLDRIDRRRICVRPLMIVESEDHPSPKTIVLCTFDDAIPYA